MNKSGEFALICNSELPNEVLEAKPHWPSLKKPNFNDLYVWGSTSFIGALNFMHDHHGQALKKGTVLHCFVFTCANEAHRPAGAQRSRANQYKIANGMIGAGHGCIVKVRGSAVPCQVLRIEFVKDYIVGKTCLEEMLTMTAIRVNNKMKAEDVVDIDTKEEGRFMITKEGFVRCVFDTNND